MIQKIKIQKGFTLIELLVVISIIGVLSSVVMVSLNDVKKKARDTVRMNDMRQIQKALEVYYYSNNETYPVGTAWWQGVCVNGGSRDTSGANAYIPNLTPEYLEDLPVDPRDVRTGWSGYLYHSNGTDYKLLCHSTGPESFPSAGEPFYDPLRPGWAWALYSSYERTRTW